ncbi:VOC family protein [Nesterenkonia xinjiangensis]|uniref:Putative glyoxalase superfamily protein PhnB n=1 Tax=Nesterenkonia xinjiangensis TaxID=225327 RepID=A0A7Z0GN36_9MICC|nr:VOC family protein [Nesterenkonia xinjiangensis]NYJ79046.1 putative glyoxalase superfamily protein PhnB [Nesterenkonia xinjiangensis]
MAVTSVYPVLMVVEVPSAADFFREVLNFETVFDAGWYISLRRGPHELALLAHDHPTVPAERRSTVSGVLVNVEVDDVDAVHRAVVARSEVRLLAPLRDEDFGQRHFILDGPEGLMVDVIQPIEPAAEFSAAYR